MTITFVCVNQNCGSERRDVVMTILRRICLILVLGLVGCGGGEEAAAPAAPTLSAPQPIAPPPIAAPPPPAAAATPVPEAATAVVPSTNPDAMLIVEPPRFVAIGLQTDQNASGEKLLAVAPTGSPDGFQFQAPAPPLTRPAGTLTQRLPPGFAPLMEHGVHSSGYPMRIVCDEDKSEMAFVPAGVFQMGSDDGPPETRPSHPMYVDPFYMDVYETTLEDYMAFRDEQKARKQRIAEAPLNAANPPQMPALGVNFSDARSYAKWAGKDLPTEAEWEKAARGNDGNPYPWGHGRPAWRGQKELEGIQPVGAEPTDISILGIRDLAGNAREWCIDFFAADAYEQLQAEARDVPRNWTGPRNPTEKFERTVKGNAPDWKLYHRDGVIMTQNDPEIGFRCVLRFYKVE